MLPGEFLTQCHDKKLGLVDRQHHARFDPHVGQLGTHDAIHRRRVRRTRTCLWVGMRRRQLNHQLNQETVILPPLPCRRAHPSCHPRASMPGWAPKFLMPAITHCDVSHARPTVLDRAMQVVAPVGAADHIALIRSLHPCAPSLVPGPESPAGIQTMSCQHHPPHCDIMPALVGQSERPPKKPIVATFIQFHSFIPTSWPHLRPTLFGPRFGTSGWVPPVLTPGAMHCDRTPALV